MKNRGFTPMLFSMLMALSLGLFCLYGNAQSINMQTSGTQTLTTCDVWVYDNGGPNGNYTNNVQSVLVVNASTPGSTISIDMGTYNLESSYDYVKVYDGNGTTGQLLLHWTSSGTLNAPITSVSETVTIVFHTDGSVTNAGFAMHLGCSSTSNRIVMSDTALSICSGYWLDPGGYNNYNVNQDVTQTICSDNGDHISVSFLSFSLGSGDHLMVYDGNSTTAPLLGDFTGTTIQQQFISSGTCLTFRFISNGSGVSSGWIAYLSCLSCLTSVSTSNGSPCAPDGIHPFCTDENPYGITYASGTSGNANAYFGSSTAACLYSTPGPAWYYMRINTPGDLLIYIEQHRPDGTGIDVDFACWGPFDANNQADFVDNLCCGIYSLSQTHNGTHRPSGGDHQNNMGGYPLGNLVDCSYNSASTEWCYIPNAQVGQYYLLLITNYSERTGTISFNTVNAGQTHSTATTDCTLLALVANDGPYCEGDTVHLFCQNPENGATYTWTGPNGWTATGQSPIIPNVTQAMAGTYSMIKHLGNNDSNPVTTDVVVNVLPNLQVTTTLDTVCSNQSATLTATGGAMYTWSTGAGGASITVSPNVDQTYYVTATSTGNCVSVDSIRIVAALTKVTNLQDTICAGEPYDNYGFSLSAVSTQNAQAQQLQATYNTAMGCDSIVTLHLTVNPNKSSVFSQTVCDSFVWADSVYTQSGDYVRHFQTVNGCDSTVTLHLTINPNVTSQFSQTVCHSFSWADSVYTQSGDYVRHFQTVNGCDSTVTLHLTVNPVIANDFSVTQCNSYTWNDLTYTQSGDYVQQFQTIMGCDSVVTLHLTIYPSVTQEFNVIDCDSYHWNDSTYTQSGDYVQHFQTSHGCDSIVTLHLTLYESVEMEFDTLVCNSLVWQNQTYTESGDYEQHLQTIFGCDSIVTMHLTIDKLVVQTLHSMPEHCGHEDGSVSISVPQHTGSVSIDWHGLAAEDQLQADNLSKGIYTIVVSDSVCTVEHEFQITEAPSPLACFNVRPSAESVPLGTQFSFLNCSQNSDSWLWNFGNDITSTTQSAEYIYPEIGRYTVTLLATDLFGCEDSTSQEVVVREDMSIYIPNSFTPNGDGINDVFGPIGSEISEDNYTLAIYDRWGDLIYMTHSLSEGWDGRCKGKLVEKGTVCKYIIHYSNKEGRPFVKSGVVHVL